MAEPQQTIQGLQDIDQLTAPLPANIPLNTALAIALCLAVLMATRFYRRARSRRSRAFRKLARLKRNVSVQHVSTEESRSLAYTIARVLAEGIDSNGITRKTLLPAALEQHGRRWSTFSDQLAVARYADDAAMTPVQLAGMIDEARFWLRQWP